MFNNINSGTKFTLLIICILISALHPISAHAGQLVKSESNSAVYEVYNGKRYAFPNENVFFTWYNDFSSVQTISDAELANVQLAGNVIIRPGTKMIKITTDPKVYAVSSNGTLRWIATEELAKSYYGDSWQKEVYDVSDALFINYQIGSPITEISNFNPLAEINMNPTFIPLTFQTSNTPEPEPTPAPSPEPEPTPNPAPQISCGNNIIESGEECDGGNRCTVSCQITTIHPIANYFSEGGYTERTLGIGDKFAIGDGINIRIDDISSYVRFSIWGKDTNQTCKLLSASGTFFDDHKKFREFTDSFIEYIGRDGDKIKIRQYYGNAAKNRCDQIAGDNAPLACSFYQSTDHYFTPLNKFYVYFYGNISQLAAEYYAEAFNNCYSSLINKIPSLGTIQPIGRNHWDVYEMTSWGSYSTDYQRISIDNSRFLEPKNQIIYKLQTIQNNTCPSEESPILHEMMHLLFARTFLQDIYDSSYKKEFPSTTTTVIGSMQLSEGFAEFMTQYINKDSGDPGWQKNKIFWDAFCGKDHILNVHNDPPDNYWSFNNVEANKLSYSETLNGRGYQSNHYIAGYCFYKRVNDECSDSAINYLLEKAIQYDGSTQSHPTMFRYLADICGEQKMMSIMTDFGFSHDLLNASQRWPNFDFPNNLQQNGCL